MVEGLYGNRESGTKTVRLKNVRFWSPIPPQIAVPNQAQIRKHGPNREYAVLVFQNHRFCDEYTVCTSENLNHEYGNRHLAVTPSSSFPGFPRFKSLDLNF